MRFVLACIIILLSVTPVLASDTENSSIPQIPLNPPLQKGEISFPPLEKGGKGGFDRGFSDEGEERFLQNIRQLTFEGINGEAYFSRDMGKIIFQSIRGEHPYYQIYTMDIDGSHQALISGDKGKTTCSYFRPDGKKIIYASTMHNPPLPPFDKGGKGGLETAPPKEERKYQWDFDPDMEIYEADRDGSNLKRLTSSEGYDAEGVYSNDGKKIVFTSQRDGDLEIYVMNADGTEQRRLTSSKGYDGGAFFSPDDKQIVFRAFRDLEKPRIAQVYIMDAEGKGERQITSTEAVNWAPYFHPSGEYIIFASNPESPRNFDLYVIRPDGTGLKRITHDEGFDGLPYFSPDGKKLLWTSSRGGGKSQIFISDWVYEE